MKVSPAANQVSDYIQNDYGISEKRSTLPRLNIRSTNFQQNFSAREDAAKSTTRIPHSEDFSDLDSVIKRAALR